MSFEGTSPELQVSEIKKLKQWRNVYSHYAPVVSIAPILFDGILSTEEDRWSGKSYLLENTNYSDGSYRNPHDISVFDSDDTAMPWRDVTPSLDRCILVLPKNRFSEIPLVKGLPAERVFTGKIDLRKFEALLVSSKLLCLSMPHLIEEVLRQRYSKGRLFHLFQDLRNESAFQGLFSHENMDIADTTRYFTRNVMRDILHLDFDSAQVVDVLRKLKQFTSVDFYEHFSNRGEDVIAKL